MPPVVADDLETIRRFLASVGVPRDVVSDTGVVDQQRMVAALVPEIEVRSNCAPPLIVRLGDSQVSVPEQASGPVHPLMRVVGGRMQPSVRLRTIAGEQVYAPFGEPPAEAWRRTLSVGAGWALILLAVVAAASYIAGHTRGHKRGRELLAAGGAAASASSPAASAELQGARIPATIAGTRFTRGSLFGAQT